MIGDMGEWNEGVWRWEWRWRRELLEREVQMFNEFLSIVNNVQLVQRQRDAWSWQRNATGVYTTNDAYDWLRKHKEEGMRLVREDFTLIWSKIIPSKIQIHAWRVLWERIPTSTKLDRRKILPQGANLNCVFCNESQETVRHVLFECAFSYQVWMECASWLGVQIVFSSNPSMNLLSFSSILEGKRGKTIAICIWECMIWLIWKARNAYLFRKERTGAHKLVEELKFRVWSWIGAKERHESSLELNSGVGAGERH